MCPCGDTMGHTFLWKILCSNILVLYGCGREVHKGPDNNERDFEQLLGRSFQPCTDASQWHMMSAFNKEMRGWPE